MSNLFKYILVTIVIFNFHFAYSQNTVDINLNDLISETQLFSEDISSMNMAWWVPIEFWEVSFKEDPYTPEAMIEEYKKMLSPYNMVLVSEGSMGLFGAIYKPKEEVIANTVLIDKQGEIYKPIPQDKLSNDIIIFTETIKPFFTNLMGEMGKNMHVLMFPTTSSKGVSIITPREEGRFIIKVNEEEFTWQTPIGSMLPPKMCPNDNTRMSGGWNYCPVHGTQLVEYQADKSGKSSKKASSEK